MTGGFSTNAQGTPDATVAVGTGVVYLSATPTSQSSQKFRVKNTASANVTISANSSGSTKYDWVYVKLDPTNLNAPNLAGDNAATLVVSRSTSSTVDDGTPPTYGYNIAVVTVANGFTTITNANIRDTRIQAGMTTTTAASSSSSWSSLGATPSSVARGFNQSYTLTFTGTDLTSTISNGMRLRCTRTVTAPTQCTDLESTSSQYFSKTTPAGMTFTDDFTVSAWVKLESYPAITGSIASRYNATSGWLMDVDSSGRVRLLGYNAGPANYSLVSSVQSLPLGRWVHIAAQLDMSAFTATPTTSYVMFDGADVPSSVTRAGTNPTALIQAGDFQIGAANSTTFFDGKIAQFAIYSAKVTQTNIRDRMSQTLVGNESSLISAYSFNNVITDLNTSNANNLTAQASVAATSTDSPYAGGNVQEYTDGTTEMGIVMANSFSTDTTVVVQVPDGYAIPTTGGLSAVSYSTQKVPYGFPAQRGKWRVKALYKAALSQATPVSGTWYNPNTALVVPVGEWSIKYSASLYAANSTNAESPYSTLSSANNTESDTEMTVRPAYLQSSSNAVMGNAYRDRDLSLTLASTLYLNFKTDSASTTAITFGPGTEATIIEAECAYI